MISDLIINYLKYLKSQSFADSTIEKRKIHLNRFFTWCKDKGLNEIKNITRETIENYQKALSYKRHSDPRQKGNLYSLEVQTRHLIAVIDFFKFCVKKNLILFNPASDLELPKFINSLPCNILTAEEANKLLETPNLRTLSGLRNRSILELLLATGMRRSEVVNLKLDDIDFEREVIFIRKSKGNKDRVIPINKRALGWIKRYLTSARTKYRFSKNSNHVFVTERGKAFYVDSLSILINRIFKKAGVAEKGSCHVFRHTMATVLLENGADIRYIQEILGHSNLTTTQIYTRVSIAKLKEVHKKTHPSSNLRNRPSSNLRNHPSAKKKKFNDT